MGPVIFLGGNGFIGFEVLKFVCNSARKIILLNRDKSWDWDKNKRELPPTVTHIKWDRLNSLQDCVDLHGVLKTHPRIRAVLDFSGFDPTHVEDAVKVLGPSADLYVYISSDSVYEVCTEKTHGGFTKETDAKRPQDPRLYEQLYKKDEYGHEKLQGEEVMAGLCSTQDNLKGCSFVSLRLTDVIGSRDNTDRWWTLQLLVAATMKTGLPIQLSKSVQNKPLSLLYVKDIAQVICDLLQMNDLNSVFGQAFNLAFDKTVTLEELVKLISNCLQSHWEITEGVTKKQKQNPEHLGLSKHQTVHYDINGFEPYPSVTKGPIDITKAKEKLHWNPSDLKYAVQEISMFYINVEKSNKFEEEKENIFQEFKYDLRSTSYSDVDKEKLRKAVTEILGLSLSSSPETE